MNRETLDRLIATIYEACAFADLDPVGAAFASAFDASAAGLVEHDFRERSCSGWLMSDGIDPAFVESYRADHASGNPWMLDERQYRDCGRAFPGEALIPAARLERSAYYRQWLRPQGFGRNLRGIVERRDRRVLYLSLMRPPSAPGFDDDDVEACALCLPHIARMIGLGRRLQESLARADMAMASMDRMRAGVILLKGGTMECNDLAREILEDGDGLHLVKGALTAARQEDTRDLHRLIDAVRLSGPSEEGVVTIARPSLRPPLHVAVLSQRTCERWIERLAPGGVALLITDPERRSGPKAARLQTAHGLTASEARLAAGLAKGAPLDEAASALGISTGTARNHLKRVFAKTGTGRQAELVALLANDICCR